MALPRKKSRAERERADAVQREDAKAVRVRDTMRQVARRIQREGKAFMRADSWQNQLTNLGIAGRDKRLAGTFSTARLTDFVAEDIWRGDDMAGRAVETVPNQIVRGGWEVLITPSEDKSKEKAEIEEKRRGRLDWLRSPNGQRWLEGRIDQTPGLTAEQRRSLAEHIRNDLASDVFPPPERQKEEDSGKEMIEAIESYCEDLGLIDVVGQALKEERGYGGSAIFPGVVDGVKDLRRPLDLERIRSVDWVDSLTPVELIPYQWYGDPTKKNYGKPELYWMQRISMGNVGSSPRVPIHESRLIVFPGLTVSKRQLREHWGWGDSVLVRMEEVLRDFHTGWQAAAVLLNEFSQLIIKIKGLAESFASGEDDLLVERARAFAEGKSVANAGIIDAEEEASRQSTPITGLPELLDRFCNRLAAAAHLPVTLLMGQAPAGLNATGASDIRSFYDNVGANRERSLKPKLRRLYSMIMAAKDGPTGGKVPEKWSLKFGPLYQLNELEEAQRRLNVANADKIYIDAGVLMPEEVAISRFGGDAYNVETQLDQDVREAFDKRAEEEAQAQAEQMQAQLEIQKKAAESGAAGGKPPPFGGKKPGGSAPAGGGGAGKVVPFKPKAAPGGAGANKSDAATLDEIVELARERGVPVVVVDGVDDVPRDENGRWTSGGGSGAKGKKFEVTPEIQAELEAEQAAEAAMHIGEDTTLRELHGLYLEGSKGTDFTKPKSTWHPVMQAVVKELKRRGIGSLTTLERKLARGDGFEDVPRDETGRWIGGGATAAKNQLSEKATGGLFSSDEVEGAPWDEKGRMEKGMGIPRKEMPQIRSFHMQEFVGELREAGVDVADDVARVGDLKPMQAFVHPDQVRYLLENSPETNLKKPIMVSRDGFILDGHHRWAALRLKSADEKIKTWRVNLSGRKLLARAHMFSKVEYTDSFDDLVERDDDWSEVERDEHGRWISSGGSSKEKKPSRAELRAFVASPAPKPPKDAPWKGGETVPPERDTWRKYMEGPEGSPYARVKDPERAELHAVIKEHFVGHRSMPGEGERPRAIIMAGGPGAGKSSLLSGVDWAQYVHVDPDGIKEKLPEFREGITAKEKFAATAVHEESSFIAGQIFEENMAEGRNIIYDGSGGNLKKFSAYITALQEKGYDVEVRYAHLPVEKAKPRIEGRAEKNGRWMPASRYEPIHDKVPRNWDALSKLADRAVMYDTDVAIGEQPRLVWERGARGAQESVHDADAVRRFKERYK